MKRWLCLALAGLGVCLLLALGHPEVGRGVDSHPCVARWGRSVGPWGEPTPAPPTAAPAARKAAPRQAHVAPSESRALHLLLLTERGVGPPWLDSRGPPGKARGTWSTPGLPARSIAQGRGCASSPRANHPAGPGTTPKKGVLQQPLANIHGWRNPNSTESQISTNRPFPSPLHRQEEQRLDWASFVSDWCSPGPACGVDLLLKMKPPSPSFPRPCRQRTSLD